VPTGSCINFSPLGFCKRIRKILLLSICGRECPQVSSCASASILVNGKVSKSVKWVGGFSFPLFGILLELCALSLGLLTRFGSPWFRFCDGSDRPVRLLMTKGVRSFASFCRSAVHSMMEWMGEVMVTLIVDYIGVDAVQLIISLDWDCCWNLVELASGSLDVVGRRECCPVSRRMLIQVRLCWAKLEII